MQGPGPVPLYDEPPPSVDIRGCVLAGRLGRGPEVAHLAIGLEPLLWGAGVIAHSGVVPTRCGVIRAQPTSTPASRISLSALSVESGATPAHRSSRSRVAKPLLTASSAVARTQ